MKTGKRKNTTHGKCRCCLSKGKHRHLMKEHSVNGVKEVYFDMFLECFNLFLSTSEKLSILICKECIQKLKAAIEFRAMVVQHEKEMLGVVEDDQNVFINVPDGDTLPSEEMKDVSYPETDTVHEDDIENHMSNNDSSEDQDSDTLNFVKGEAELLQRFAPDSLKLLPTRTSLSLSLPAYVRHLKRLKGKNINPQMIPILMRQNGLQKKSNKLKSEMFLIREQVRTLIECSNMTPFKSRYGHGFTCIFCSTTLDSIEQLKEHNSTHKGNIKSVMPKGKNDNLVFYADVTDLKCKLCDKNCTNLNEIKDHLVKIHKKRLEIKQDRVVPFKIVVDKEFECQICSAPFPNLGAIKSHMSVHYKYYICDICGAGFMTKFRLESHINALHSTKIFACNLCSKQFSAYNNYRIHLTLVHKKLRNIKCHVKSCLERFQDYFSRRKHMITSHGATYLNYMCSICEKKFNRRYALSLHMKRTHIAEKNFECTACSYRCFSKGELGFHMVKHSGEKIYQCEFCKKVYARKKTLKEHLRIHNNDRRFVCAICGQAFVQNCSLKGHVKTHHPEYGS